MVLIWPTDGHGSMGIENSLAAFCIDVELFN